MKRAFHAAMSWNVVCHLVANGEKTEVPLRSISSEDAWCVVYSDGRGARSPRPWRDAAKTYLTIVARRLDEPMTSRRGKGNGLDEHAERKQRQAVREDIKEARMVIGLAWRIADEQDGALVFEVV